MKTIKKLSLLLLGGLMIASCGSDPDPVLVSSIIASGTSFEDGSTITSDLNGASSADGVALDAVITAVFDKAIVASSATSANVRLTGNGEDVLVAVSATGTNITIDPTDDLTRGTAYTLSLNNIVAEDEGMLGSISRTFTTEGRAPVIVPSEDNQIAYWTFDGVADDATGDFPAGDVISVEYGTDRFGQGTSTATFDGDASVIVIPGADRLLSNRSLSLSFWMKTNSQDHTNANGDPEGHFVFGLAAFKGIQMEINNGDYNQFKFGQTYMLPDGTTTGEDAFFNGDGQFADNGGWQGWDFHRDLTGSGGVEALIKDRWVHVALTYDAAARTHRIYLDGELMKGHDFNLWPEGAAKLEISGVAYGGAEPSELPELAFGFVHSPGGELWDDTPWGDYDKPTSKHFKGDLDDFRVWSVGLSADEVKTLYDAEKN